MEHLFMGGDVPNLPEHLFMEHLFMGGEVPNLPQHLYIAVLTCRNTYTSLY